MNAETTRPDDRMLADLQAEVRSLIGTIRASLAELIFTPDHDIATRFLTVAPVEACVRLADLCALADAVGLPVAQLKADLPTEDQLILEIVTGVYAAGAVGPRPPRSPDLPELVRLVDELARTHDTYPAP